MDRDYAGTKKRPLTKAQTADIEDHNNRQAKTTSSQETTR